MSAMRLFGSFLLSALLVGCGQQATTTESESVIRPVKLYTVGNDEIAVMRSFPAEVVANQGSYLAFRVNGELLKFPVLAGQEVKKGQLLAKLDPKDFQLQYEDRKARYELANSQLKRIKQLYKKNIVSAAELDKAVADQSIAAAAANIAKTNLENSELRAPFNGTIAKVFVKNFENIQAKQNILRLETRDFMDVVIQLPERFVARVKKNSSYQPEVVFDSFPSKKYKLTIKEWDTQADPNTLTYRAVFSLPLPKDFNLLAGMTGLVYIDPSQVTQTDTPHLFVPAAAVFSDPAKDKANNSFVWVYDSENQTVNKQAVKVGKLQHENIEILSGLQQGQVIVAAGVHYLKDNMKVRQWQKERGL